MSDTPNPNSIAIIGMSCRFPGGVDSPEAFWRLLETGGEGVGKIPSDRWDVERFFQPGPATPGKMTTQHGNFVESIDQFDAQFFGITPREAARMDPQQRMALELAWEALENAGLPAENVAGSETAVFAGITSFDYSMLQAPDLANFNGHAGFGAAHCVAAGRISYFFDLHGPTCAVDTACSSSMVAVHLACQSLRNRECSAALAGGVNVVLVPHVGISLSEWGALSADGRCKTFDAAADGFGRGEGCGFVVLKRLPDAIADGDNILAVIRGTALNQDGQGTRLSSPNGRAQVSVVRKALADAGVEASQISFVEAHGTGTRVGDPIEVEALTEVIGQPRPDASRCALGAVKANIGHLEAAAGVAGLIKLVLCFQHDKIPVQINLKNLNPSISLEGTPFYIPAETVPWVRETEPRLAGISAFGLSGTNAHMILEDPPKPVAAPEPTEGPYLMPISARRPEALRQSVELYREYMDSNAAAGASAYDIAFTAGVRRSHHRYRAAVVGSTIQELSERLDALTDRDFERPPAPGGMPEPLVMVFSGQGSQWAGMGVKLMTEEPIFKRKVVEVDALLRKLSGWSVIKELKAPESKSRLGDTEVAQPAIFAIQAGLLALYESWGIRPDAVIGHSSGEIAAAYAAGVLTLEEAVRVVFNRSRLMQLATGKGRMAAVGLGRDDAEQAIASHRDSLSVAAINAPGVTVIAGEAGPLESVLDALKTSGVFCKDLGVNYAFHTAQMEPILDELIASLEGIDPKPSQAAFISTVTGGSVAGPELGPFHWATGIRQPVRFADAMQSLLADQHRVFLEVGPQPVLATPMSQCLRQAETPGTIVSSLRQGHNDKATLLKAVAAIYVAGCEMDWRGLYPVDGRQVVLPNYPWQHQRHWVPGPAWFNLPQDDPKPGLMPAPNGAPAGSEGSREVIGSFYDSLYENITKTAEKEKAFEHLTFAPLLEEVPGFSWIRTVYGSEAVDGLTLRAHVEMSKTAQRQMREVLFRGIDFDSIRSVLDFGCGYGTDLLTLAETHPHLVCDGYTLSKAQADLGNRKAREAGVQDRVSIYERDSTAEEFPREYDLVFGFEVASYIRDKHKLFAHIERHLSDGGFVVMADFVAKTVSEIAHEATNSFITPAEAWAEVLAEYKLRVIECVDVSKEVANFLHDPDAERNLAELIKEKGDEGAISQHFASYDNLGQLFRRKLAAYTLFSIQKDRFLTRSEIARNNREKLGSPALYSEVIRREGVLQQPLTASPAAAREEFTDWLFEISWDLAPRPEPSSSNVRASTPGTWLILADEKRVGQESAELLESKGGTVVLVSSGNAYERSEGGRFRVDPANAEHFRRLLSDVLAPGSRPLRGVLHLWGLDARPPKRMTLRSLEADQAKGAGSLLHLVQALSELGWSEPPRLWIGTQGAQAPEGGEVSLAQGSLWGLGRTIAVEKQAFSARLVDLDPVAAARTAAVNLVDEMLASDPEDQVAYRGGGRFVPRLVQRPELAASAPFAAFIPDATYLITGGLGGLGLATARWMVVEGARNLVLLQRSEVPPRSAWEDIDPASPAASRIAAIKELEAAGASVHTFAVDVAREDEVARVLEDVTQRMPPLRGIVHAAGVSDFAMIPQIKLEGLLRVAGAKISGAWNLHRLTLSEPLDFFVMFSSLSSWLGSPGFGSYAAANAGQDAVAHFRQAEELPALSINWGPWGEVGMGILGDFNNRMAHRGLHTIPTDQGIAALGKLLGQGKPEVVVAPLNLEQVRTAWPQVAASPLMARLFGSQPVAQQRPPAPSIQQLAPEPATKEKEVRLESTNRKTLLSAEPAVRAAMLEEYLISQTAKVLEIAVTDIDYRQALTRMGMDSLMAVELRNHIEADLAVSVQLVTFLEGASLSDLATDLLRTQLSGTSESEASVPVGMIEVVEQMSDEEVEALLAEKRKQLAQ